MGYIHRTVSWFSPFKYHERDADSCPLKWLVSILPIDSNVVGLKIFRTLNVFPNDFKKLLTNNHEETITTRRKINQFQFFDVFSKRYYILIFLLILT